LHIGAGWARRDHRGKVLTIEVESAVADSMTLPYATLGLQLVNRAVPDVQPESAPVLGAAGDFAVNCRMWNWNVKRATASPIFVMLEMLSCLGRRA
jgi:hypothetical protein